MPRREPNYCIVLGAIGLLIVIIGGLSFLLPAQIHSGKGGVGGSNNNNTVDPLTIGWHSTGSGLALTILNSCDDTWTPIFDEYIDKWDNGVPDSLTLVTTKRPHAQDCEAYMDLVHVCNGDYGYTNWSGIAYIWRDSVSGNIVSVLALLNNYHLEFASAAQRRYTMCHELGHTFGLPHTNVDFFDEPLGDCLDYTFEYGHNTDPGEVNFNRLFDLYGSVSVTTNTTNEEPLQDVAAIEANETLAPLSMQMEQYEDVKECLETKSCSECMESLPPTNEGDNRRMLYKNELGESCELTVDAFVLEIHKLLVDG